MQVYGTGFLVAYGFSAPIPGMCVTSIINSCSSACCRPKKPAAEASGVVDVICGSLSLCGVTLTGDVGC